MSSVRPLIVRLSTSALLLLAVSPGVRAATVFDPALRFRTLSTGHFIVYFHQGEERLAARLAAIAEDTWQKLAVPLGRTPPALTHVVLVDQTELANGSATPLPYNTIVVTAASPAGSEFIGNTDDWLRLVFTHEYTHIIHLDQSGGWARFLRNVLGRTPLAFPNLFLPRWQIEGLAAYEESVITGAGRLHAGDFQAIVAEAAAAGRPEPLGRVNGGLTDWPGGDAAYAYGLGFHAFLARRYGDDRLAMLATSTARRVPFTASRVFERIYSRSLGSLWQDYQDSLRAPPRSSMGAGTSRLTHHGFNVAGPRFAPPACDRCAAEIFYSVSTPHGFPALYRLARDGSAPVRAASRYLGSTTASTRDVVYFDQLELRRNSGLYSDLYALDRRTGTVARLTTDARLLDPDISPDGGTLVCARAAPGRRDLVLVSTGSTLSITTLISDPETQFNAPRWSPDGRTIAVERQAIGRRSEIVIVDAATGAVRALATIAGGRVVTPAWRPDGRALIAAAAAGDDVFNLYEIAVDIPMLFAATDPPPPAAWRPLTHTTGGALWPDVSPDGATIVYAGYTVDGFDLFEMPYPTAARVDRDGGAAVLSVPPAAGLAHRAASDAIGTITQASEAVVAPAPRLAGQVDAVPGGVPAAAPYRPASTLRPTSWSPIIAADSHQLRLGFATGGADVLGYHGYAAAATWLATGPSGTPIPSRASPDWDVSYQYARWRPTVWLAASASTAFFAGPPGDTGTPSVATLRERQIEAGVLLPVRQVRVSQTAVASLVRAVDDFTRPDDVSSRNRTAWRGGWSLISARSYGYSISREDGVSVGVTGELARQAWGASGDADAVTVDGRLYVSPFRRHSVLAVRLAGGLSNGDGTVRRVFHLGGAQPNLNGIDFGRQSISLLRGFATDTFAGSRVALLNADYRWPVARPQWSRGTWPLLLHTVHAAAFADVGHAWTRTFEARDLKSSLGGELSFDVIAGYSFRVDAAFGAAWGHDGSGGVRDGARVYLRLGRAF